MLTFAVVATLALIAFDAATRPRDSSVKVVDLTTLIGKRDR
jgi:hypothetical protein